jgi:hypothetical protein
MRTSVEELMLRLVPSALVTVEKSVVVLTVTVSGASVSEAIAEIGNAEAARRRGRYKPEIFFWYIYLGVKSFRYSGKRNRVERKREEGDEG